jgi:hypothetical protein
MIAIVNSKNKIHWPAGSVPALSHLSSCTPTESNLCFLLHLSILLQLVLEFIFGFVYRPLCNNVKV